MQDGEWQNYQIDESFTLVAEIDGVRIVTNTVCEFLQRVPDCLVDVFLAGSCEPAAMLYVAYQELFEKHSAKVRPQHAAHVDLPWLLRSRHCMHGDGVGGEGLH